MTRPKAAQRGKDLARAVTYERDGAAPGAPAQHQLTRRARARLERPARGERLQPGSAWEPAPAVPIRPAVLRTHRLTVKGELGQHSAAALEAEIDALCAGGIDELLLDLEGLRRIDATGARVIALRCALCEKRGVRVEVERVTRAVREAFRAAGQLELLPPGDRPAGGAPGSAHEDSPKKVRKIV
jgi:anti-anti-sigma factor